MVRQPIYFIDREHGTNPYQVDICDLLFSFSKKSLIKCSISSGSGFSPWKVNGISSINVPSLYTCNAPFC
jgi:hypothetical protein